MQNIKIIKKVIISLLLLMFLFLAHQRSLDAYAESYTEQGLSRALVTFAVSRSLNGVISVVQGTEVAVSPAGIGLNFAPGQILDPINDLIERFSWVVLASGTSLGIQRLLLEITSSTGVTWLLSALLLMTIISLWLPKVTRDDYASLITLLSKGFLLIIFLRFSIPVIAIANEVLYLNFSEQTYQQAQVSLESSASNLQNSTEGSSATATPDENATSDNMDFIGKVEEWFDRSDKSFDFEEQVAALKSEADNISQQVINMIVVFVMQTLILPLFFLWLMVRIAKLSISQLHL